MIRFLGWFRWEWREHWKLVAGGALGAVLFSWIALMIGGSGVGRGDLEVVLVVQLALLALILAAGLFSSERRHGAEAIVLRTPGARMPLFFARLAFFVTAWCAAAAVAAFGMARLAQMEKGRASLQPPELGAFLWPRWIVADFVVLALALGGIALLVSAWTRRVAIAFVVSLVVLAAVLFPWIRLGADRMDFFPFLRMGAVPLAAWPLLALALLALGASWLRGRRYVNRPWRAVGYGVLVLALGMGVVGAWSAKALADFDVVRADTAGFRMAGYVVGPHVPTHVRNPGHPSFLPLDCVALAPDGKTVWVQGYRRDAGTWPRPRPGPYGSDARDFREDRGTWSWQWRIDLESGTAQRVGAIRERLGWTDLGSGELHGVLRGVDRAAKLEPRSFALLGRPGRSDEARIVDLATGAASKPTRDRARAIAASGTSVRDAQGRPAWLEYESDRPQVGTQSATHPRLFVVTAAGRTQVEDEFLQSLQHPMGTTPRGWSALAVPGGWVHVQGPKIVTIEAATARVRRSGDGRGQLAGARMVSSRLYLDTRFVLVLLSGSSMQSEWRYALLDLETDTLGPKLVGPATQYILQTTTADGRFLTLMKGDGGRRFALWAPKTDERTALAIRGGPQAFPEDSYPLLLGADTRGNIVLRVVTYPRVAGEVLLRMQTLYFHAKTRQLFALDSGTSLLRGQGDFRAIGIDERDRVVGLGNPDDSGYRSIVRFDPEDGSQTVLFPKPK